MLTNEIIKEVVEFSESTKMPFVRLASKGEAKLLGIPELSLLELTDVKSGEWYDYVSVLNFTVDSDRRVNLNTLVSLTEKADSITVEASLFKKNVLNVIANFSDLIINNKAIVEADLKCTLPQGIDENDFGAVVRISYNKKGSGIQEINRVVILDDNINKYMSYNHIRPTKEPYTVYLAGNSSAPKIKTKDSAECDPILISLYREPTDSSDCDYICKFGKIEGEPNIAIPYHGAINLKDNFVFSENLIIKRIVLEKISNEYAGATALEYNKECNKEIICKGKSFVDFAFEDGWGMPYKEPGGLSKVNFNLTVYLSTAIENRDIEDYKSEIITFDNICITSNSNVNNALYNKIRKLQLMWGCIEENTLILMADNSLRPIKEINVGDKIRGVNGISVVTNIWKGLEYDYCIKIVAARQELILSTSHPIFVNGGWKQAENLVNKDELLDKNGNFICINSIDHYVSETPTIVYNLSLEPSGEIIANGFVVGDFERQNMINP